MTKLKVGDRIKVLECDWLATPEVMATIRYVEKDGYVVHCDGDDEDAFGPIDFEGNVVCDMP